MVEVYDYLEMWLGNQNVCATQNECCSQNKQMTAVGYILNMEEIVEWSWQLFQHGGAAAFEISERSPLRPALSAKDLQGGRTQVLNVHQIRWLNCHPGESDEDTVPESIADTENQLNWNGDLNNPNYSDYDGMADDELDMEHNNGIEDPECPA